MEQEKKRNFFKQAFASVVDFDSYQDFALSSIGKTIRYFLEIVLVFIIIAAIGFTYYFGTIYQKVKTYINEEMPEFSYQDGVLSVEGNQPYIYDQIEEFAGIVIVDTQTEEQSVVDGYREKIEPYQNGIILLRDEIIVKNAMSTATISQKYEELLAPKNITSFTKQDIVNGVNSIQTVTIYVTIYLAMLVYLFILYLPTLLLDTLLFGVFTFLMARIFGIRMKYRSGYGIAVHALTLPILLNALYIVVNLMTGFEIKYFSIMYNTVALIYLVTALIIIRSNLIKRQRELMKIEKEQEKVKIELKEQKEKEKKEEKPEEKEKKKEENPKEKKKKPKEEKKEKRKSWGWR